MSRSVFIQGGVSAKLTVSVKEFKNLWKYEPCRSEEEERKRRKKEGVYCEAGGEDCSEGPGCVFYVVATERQKAKEVSSSLHTSGGHRALLVSFVLTTAAQYTVT